MLRACREELALKKRDMLESNIRYNRSLEADLIIKQYDKYCNLPIIIGRVKHIAIKRDNIGY